MDTTAAVITDSEAFDFLDSVTSELITTPSFDHNAAAVDDSVSFVTDDFFETQIIFETYQAPSSSSKPNDKLENLIKDSELIDEFDAVAEFPFVETNINTNTTLGNIQQYPPSRGKSMQRTKELYEESAAKNCCAAFYDTDDDDDDDDIVAAKVDGNDSDSTTTSSSSSSSSSDGSSSSSSSSSDNSSDDDDGEMSSQTLVAVDLLKKRILKRVDDGKRQLFENKENIGDLLNVDWGDDDEGEEKDPTAVLDVVDVSITSIVDEAPRRRSSRLLCGSLDVGVRVGDTDNELAKYEFVVDESATQSEDDSIMVPFPNVSESEMRAKHAALLKKYKPIKDPMDRHAQLKKFINADVPPTMRVSHYKGLENLDADGYVSLYDILTHAERAMNVELKIAPSDLGTMLKYMDRNMYGFPQETLPIVNHSIYPRSYKLRYGFVPLMYNSHVEVLIRRLVKSRSKEPYDLFEGELELMVMALWRISVQDLRFYNERVNRKSKKDVLLYLYHNFKKAFRSVLNATPDANKIDRYAEIREILKSYKRYMYFSDDRKIQTMALVVLKELMMFVYNNNCVSATDVKLWSVVCLDLGVHHVAFSHTYNHLIKNRVNIFNWFAQMVGMYAETQRSPNEYSVWDRCLHVNKIAYDADVSVAYKKHCSVDGRTNKRTNNATLDTVITKRDVRSMFHKFFKTNADVPLKLLIKLDNFFMIFAHYFVQYLRDTALVHQKEITLRNITCFLKIFNHDVWPRYYGNLLNAVDVAVENVKRKLCGSFVDCLRNQQKRYCNFDANQISIDPAVGRVLVDLGFDVLLWILGPVLAQNGNSVRISAPACAGIFIKRLETFETQHVLLNKKIPFRLDYPEWLTGGTANDDCDYDEKLDNSAYYDERGAFMFPERSDSDLFRNDETDDDDDDGCELSGENRDVVDLGIPEGEMSDFNDSDSETDVCDTYQDRLDKDDLLNALLKRQKQERMMIDSGTPSDADLERLRADIDELKKSLRVKDHEINVKETVGAIKRKRMETELMVIDGEYSEVLFDAGIVPKDIAKYLNRTPFVKPPKRQKLCDDTTTTTTNVAVSQNSIRSSSQQRRDDNKRRRSVTSNNLRKYLLTGDEVYKVVDGIRTFGLVTNVALNRNKRSTRGCNLCDVPKSGTLNMRISETYAVSACVPCAEKIKTLLVEGVVEFDYVQRFLTTRIDCRYKAPLLFDARGKMFTEMTPKIESTKDMYVFTYNKLDKNFGKRVPLKSVFEDLCKRYNWDVPMTDRKKSKRKSAPASTTR
ncbi:uncharacterized protein LOC112598282 [Melanaphis sacchari]|uniref:uncharacterized protein LOC112598282 n=1 Tax=Melanaphis sacchari TaxID=742174 RepID=UPI000DC15A92|nr:uncharacterized protein LOC112598282 [Melanaphis sacchari]